MAGRYVLALDAGGGGAGALLFDLEQGTATVAHRRWRHLPADPGDRWAWDFDWSGAWRLFGEAAREVMARGGAEPDEVVAIAAAGMRHGMAVIGRDGRESWAAPNRDARAAGQASLLANEMGPEIYRRTGLWPAPMLPIARLRWLRECQPEILDGACAILSMSDWLTWRLSGQAVSEASQASATGLFGLAPGDWDGELAGAAGIDVALLPPLTASGAVAGELCADAAAHLGLKPGTPVAVGAADSQCALLGAGLTRPGGAAVIAGTTLPVLAVTGTPRIDGGRRLWSGRHAIDGCWLLESNGGAAGEALELLAGMLYPGERNGVARLAAEAGGGPPGAHGTLSDLGTTLFDAGNLRLPVGTVSFATLIASARAAPRSDLVRAVLEGIAFGARANLEQVEAVSGSRAPAIHLAGGLARSDAWARILADATGRGVLRTRIAEASLLGAAACAAAGAGRFANLEDAAIALSAGGVPFEPSENTRTLYEDLYVQWQRYRASRALAEDEATEHVLRMAEGSAAVPLTAPRPAPPGPVRPRLLVTAPLDAASLRRLQEHGDVRYEPFMESQRVLTDDDLVEALDGVDVLVTEVDVVDAASLARLPRLRAIFSCRADPVNIDVAACTAHGVAVMNAPGRNARSVAELTLAFILALVRKIAPADRFLRDPATAAGDIARMGMAHAEFEGRELGGLTVGLVGFGYVGRAVAAVLRPLGVSLLTADPFADATEALAEGAELVSLADLLDRSDVVSLHAPVTEQTRGMFGPTQFAAMRRGTLFINTARAALVDEDALYDALASGHLGGAALDVFAQEPPGFDHRLLRLANVIATPHIGGNTADVARRQGEMVCEGVAALLRGDRPATLLNPETMAAFRWEGPRRSPTPAEIAALARGRGPAVTDLEVDEPAPARATEGGRSRAGLARVLQRLRRGGRDRSGARPDSAQVQPIPTLSAAADGEGYWPTLFARFTALLPEDEAIRRFSRSKKVMVRYHVQDLDLVFHTGFTGDPPVAGLGEPPVQPHLTLRMSSAVLDDIFMERISGMKAAMSGKMAFSGNTMRAMALQRVQKDLNRIYQRVRGELGEPPEEPSAVGHRPSAIGHPPSGAQRGAGGEPPGLTADGRGPAAVKDERDEMMALVNELFAAHLLTSTGGNVSIRRPGHPDEAWITPSALPKGHLHAGMLVRIGMDGEPLDEGSLAPSSERLMHTAIYRARPEIEAIVHSHGPKAFALGLAGLPFLPVSTEAAFIGELPRVPFTMPGTDELAEAVVAALGRGHAALLVNHGAIVAATSLRRAVDMTAVIEETADALLECQAAGRTPPVLTDDVVAQLREIGEMMG